MLIRAMKCGCEHCEDKNDFAAMGSSLVENEPGMIIMSKAGAFSNEFCNQSQSLFIQTRSGSERRVRVRGMW